MRLSIVDNYQQFALKLKGWEEISKIVTGLPGMSLDHQFYIKTGGSEPLRNGVIITRPSSFGLRFSPKIIPKTLCDWKKEHWTLYREEFIPKIGRLIDTEGLRKLSEQDIIRKRRLIYEQAEKNGILGLEQREVPFGFRLFGEEAGPYKESTYYSHTCDTEDLEWFPKPSNIRPGLKTAYQLNYGLKGDKTVPERYCCYFLDPRGKGELSFKEAEGDGRDLPKKAWLRLKVGKGELLHAFFIFYKLGKFEVIARELREIGDQEDVKLLDSKKGAIAAFDQIARAFIGFSLS